MKSTIHAVHLCKHLIYVKSKNDEDGLVTAQKPANWVDIWWKLVVLSIPPCLQGTQQNAFHALGHELPLQVGGCKGTVGPLVYLGNQAERRGYEKGNSPKNAPIFWSTFWGWQIGDRSEQKRLTQSLTVVGPQVSAHERLPCTRYPSATTYSSYSRSLVWLN